MCPTPTSSTGRCSSTTTAVPGKTYLYRVVARNSAGESEPSNVVGPVAVKCRTLVDECRDLTLTASHEGDVTISTEIARQRQEDSFRFAMPAGTSVVYRVDGPISAYRIFTFAADVKAALDIAVSADGKEFRPLGTDRWSFPTAQSVYGYRTPVLFEGNADGNNGTYLRITSPSSTVKYSEPDQKPLEISRVEIDFDCAASKIRQPRLPPQSTRPSSSTGRDDSPPRSTPSMRPQSAANAASICAQRFSSILPKN